MNRLRELRENQNLSLRQLGDKLEMNASVLGNYEREDRRPKQETWEILADYFKVSVPYIMGLSDSPIELTMDDLTDLNGDKLFDEDDGLFNTQNASMEISKFFVKKIKPSEKRKVFYIIKLTDPKNLDIRFTCLEAIYDIDFIKVNILKNSLSYTIPVQLSFPKKEDSINEVSKYFVSVKNGEIEGLNSDNFSVNIFSSFITFKEILDKANKNNDSVNSVLRNILSKTFDIFSNHERKDIFIKNSENKYIFVLNYFNKEVKELIL